MDGRPSSSRSSSKQPKNASKSRGVSKAPRRVAMACQSKSAGLSRLSLAERADQRLVGRRVKVPADQCNWSAELTSMPSAEYMETILDGRVATAGCGRCQIIFDDVSAWSKIARAPVQDFASSKVRRWLLPAGIDSLSNALDAMSTAPQTTGLPLAEELALQQLMQERSQRESSLG